MLADLHLHTAPLGGGKAGELRRYPVGADAHRDQVLARRVRDGFEGVAVGVVYRADDDARQHAAGLIGDGADDRRFLRERAHR